MESSDLLGCSNFCAYYSVIGALFMFLVATLISKQPFYIGGLEDVDLCKSSAVGAMGMFLFTFVASVAHICYEKANPYSRTNTNLNSMEEMDFVGRPGMRDFPDRTSSLYELAESSSSTHGYRDEDDDHDGTPGQFA
uniref:Uncharacterized protein n=1 Tax=Attheya septentrionalis TaxID=420275 RepID=A0A6T7ISQ1_9STRA|mmetsp:Transcript_26254/g.47622  ORF Transcript_26254/g.47622 Transcript_26254/m.47622 type:complete len:137 (+) Transcript_26254:114-524(+)